MFKKIEEKLKNIQIPAWLGPIAEHAVEIAEIVGDRDGLSGKEKKEQAKKIAKLVMLAIDIPGIPEPLEAAVEGLIIDAAIELAWTVKLGPQGNEARRDRRQRKRARRKADA